MTTTEIFLDTKPNGAETKNMVNIVLNQGTSNSSKMSFEFVSGTTSTKDGLYKLKKIRGASYDGPQTEELVTQAKTEFQAFVDKKQALYAKFVNSLTQALVTVEAHKEEITKTALVDQYNGSAYQSLTNFLKSRIEFYSAGIPSMFQEYKRIGKTKVFVRVQYKHNLEIQGFMPRAVYTEVDFELTLNDAYGVLVHQTPNSLQDLLNLLKVNSWSFVRAFDR